MKKIKESKNKEKKSTNVGLLITFLLALIVVGFGYVAMLKVEENILSNYEKETICVVKGEIAAHTLLTAENIGTYIGTAEIDKTIIPSDSIKDVESLYGKSLRVALKPGTAITESMVYTVNDIYKSMNKPKELGLSMSDLVQGVSGIVRTGDYIDIYILQKATYTYNLSDEEMQQIAASSGEAVLKHVYVSGAFDVSGSVIPNDDKITVCQRVNVVVEEKDIEAIYSKLLDGYVYILKEISPED